jgi:transcriptional regulator with XRE-family HTH domain
MAKTKFEGDQLERAKTIAANLDVLYKVNHVTKHEVAAAIGMSKNILTEYSKLRSTPSDSALTKLANYFGVDKSDIDTTYQTDGQNVIVEVPMDTFEITSNDGTLLCNGKVVSNKDRKLVAKFLERLYSGDK